MNKEYLERQDHKRQREQMLRNQGRPIRPSKKRVKAKSASDAAVSELEKATADPKINLARVRELFDVDPRDFEGVNGRSSAAERSRRANLQDGQPSRASTSRTPRSGPQPKKRFALIRPKLK